MRDRQPTLAVALGLWQDRPPDEALETARAADGLGYRELWIGEMATYDAFALATAVALQTERIALTVGPLAVGVRDPMTVAVVAAIGDRHTDVTLGTLDDQGGRIRTIRRPRRRAVQRPNGHLAGDRGNRGTTGRPTARRRTGGRASRPPAGCLDPGGGRRVDAARRQVRRTLIGSVAVLGDEDTVRGRPAAYGPHVDQLGVLPCSTDHDPAGARTLRVLARLTTICEEKS